MKIERLTPRTGKAPRKLGPVLGIHIARAAVRIAELDRRKRLVRLLELAPGATCQAAMRAGSSIRLFAPLGFAVLSTHEAVFRNVGVMPDCGEEVLREQLVGLAESMGRPQELVGDLFVASPCGSRPAHGCLAIAREAAVTRALGLIRGAGAIPGGVGLEMLALFRLWLHAEPSISGERIALAHADGRSVSVALFDHASPIAMRQVVCDGLPPSPAAVEGFVEALVTDMGLDSFPRTLVTGDEKLSGDASPIGAVALCQRLSGPEQAPLVQRCMAAIAAAIAG